MKIMNRSLAALGLAVAVVLLLSTAACSTTQSAGAQVNDSEIAAKVKAKLAADPDVNPFDIDVDVNDGMVRLAGNVDDSASRMEAGRLAEDTMGVRGVNNEITVGEKSVGERIDDAAIVTKIKAKLIADLEVAATNIDVDSEMGTVTLSGMVKSNEARMEAEKLAKDTSGVKHVHNRLTVGDDNM